MRLTTYHHPVPLSRNLGTLTSWNPLGLSRPVTGLILPQLLRKVIFHDDTFPGVSLSLLSTFCSLVSLYPGVLDDSDFGKNVDVRGYTAIKVTVPENVGKISKSISYFVLSPWFRAS